MANRLLTIRVTVKDGTYIVSDKELAEYGSGKTLAEALLDYFTSLAGFKAALQKIGEEKLGSDLKRCLDLLNTIELGAFHQDNTLTFSSEGNASCDFSYD